MAGHAITAFFLVLAWSTQLFGQASLGQLPTDELSTDESSSVQQERSAERDKLLQQMRALSDEDKLAVYRARKIQKFFSQPFFVAEQFTGYEGRYVKIEDTIAGFQAILNGDCDHIPEAKFSYAGTIDEVMSLSLIASISSA